MSAGSLKDDGIDFGKPFTSSTSTKGGIVVFVILGIGLITIALDLVGIFADAFADSGARVAARGGTTGLCHGGTFALLVLSPSSSSSACGGGLEGERTLLFVRTIAFGPAALATRSAAMISAARAGRGIGFNFGMSCNLKQELLGVLYSTAELGP